MKVFDATKSMDRYRNVVYVDENTKPSMLRGVLNSEATVYINSKDKKPAEDSKEKTLASIGESSETTKKSILRKDVEDEIVKKSNGLEESSSAGTTDTKEEPS